MNIAYALLFVNHMLVYKVTFLCGYPPWYTEGMRKSRSGFTVVELLIVIVVIAILAAVTVVAYGNMRARARHTQQVAKLDQLGRAIQLYRTENGTSLAKSGSGSAGDGYGGFYAVSPHSNYTSVSIHSMLAATGNLPNFSQEEVGALGIRNILLTPCTNLSNPRWVVVANLDPAPQLSVEDQVIQTGCTNTLITLYTDRDPGVSSSYGGNFVKAY